MLWFAVAAHLMGQTPSPDGPTTIFKVRTELVTVPVIVTDKSGGHVRGLKKEDFVLLEDGKQQTVATFEEIREPRIPLLRAKRPNQFSNIVVPGTAPVPITILVFDLVNTPLPDQDHARAQLVRYLTKSGERKQLVALFAITRDGVKVLHDFTSDASAVAASLGNVRREGNMVEQASQEKLPSDPMLGPAMRRMVEAEQRLESTERRAAIITTLQSLQQIAQLCSGIPGRKGLLWATAGFPFTIDELHMSMNIAGVKGNSIRDVSDLYRQTWRVLNQAEVAVYPVDVRGLVNPEVPDMNIQNPNPEFGEHAQWLQTETIGTFRTVADATGGRAFFNTNDLDGAFQAAANDNSSYYLLSYYLAHSNKKPGWHKLEVKVQREKVQVRCRSGFFVRTASPEASVSELHAALASPLAYTGIPITGEWQQVTPSPEAGKRRSCSS